MWQRQLGRSTWDSVLWTVMSQIMPFLRPQLKGDGTKGDGMQRSETSWAWRCRQSYGPFRTWILHVLSLICPHILPIMSQGQSHAVCLL